jgi:glucodextranase-like protein
MAVRTRALALALAAFACGRPRSAGPSPSVASIAGETAGQHAVVTARSGKVQLLRANDGSVSEAQVGDQLGVRDAVRTAEGDADLTFDGVRMRLHDASQLTVEELHRQKMRARVRGSVESDVAENATLDVEAEGGDAVAHSDGGHFFITSDGHGVVAVATVTGSVHLAGNGKSVEVAKGQVSRVTRAQPTPSQPAAALRRVLLSVQWPNQKETNRATLPIVGRVEPGSRVFVQGVPVAVEPGGSFHAEVPLREGRQKIAVVTVDALGRKRQVESVVMRDDSAPGIKVKKKLWQWR